MRQHWRCLLLLLCLGFPVGVHAQDDPSPATNQFTVATYNVRNWLTMPRWGKPDQPKPLDEKMAVVECLADIQPDVLALQEIGSDRDLIDIVGRLRNAGLVYPDGEWIEGVDTNRHVAILSRFPIIKRNSVTDATYTLSGQTLGISRGIIDVTVGVSDAYHFRALVAHLKSKRPVPDFNQAAMRLAEANLLRRHAEKLIKTNPRLNLLVMGDLNDTPMSQPLVALRGQEPPFLHTIEAIDRDGQDFTFFWKSAGERSRLDYLLVNEAMQAELVRDGFGIGDSQRWNQASDHRAVYARFYALDQDQPPAASAADSNRTSATTSSARPSPPWVVIVIGVAVLLVGGIVVWQVSSQRR